jgi:iron complex outermembrane receptor protein
MIAALKATGYVGNYNTTDITMDGYDVRVSRPVFKMPGGDVQLGLGTDYRRTSYSQLPNAAVAHAEILFDDDQPSFNLNRKNIGGFAELSMPISKQIEVNAAARYDAFTGVTDSLNQKTTGDEQSAGTYKLSARFQPSNSMMFRAAWVQALRHHPCLLLRNH